MDPSATDPHHYTFFLSLNGSFCKCRENSTCQSWNEQVDGKQTAKPYLLPYTSEEFSKTPMLMG